MIPAETVAAVMTWGTGVALAKWETMWVHRNRNHKGLESEERTVTEISSCRAVGPPGHAHTQAQILAEGIAAWI